MKKYGFIFLLLGIAPTLPADDGSAINERHPLSATSKVTIKNVDGLIEVVAWDKNEVEVTGAPRGNKKKMTRQRAAASQRRPQPAWIPHPLNVRAS